jgi:plastocyanin
MRVRPAIAALVVLASSVALSPWSAFSTGEAHAAETVSVAAGDNWFCDASFEGGVCETIVSVGDTVSWLYATGGSVHTVAECGPSCDTPTDTPLWRSGILSTGDSFAFTFDEPGSFLYRCEVHPDVMRGRIEVEAAAVPTPTAPPPSSSTSPSTSPSPSASLGESEAPDRIPEYGGEPPAAETSVGWLVAGGVLLAGSLLLIRITSRRR